MNRAYRTCGIGLCLLGVSAAVAGGTSLYDFTINPNLSGLDADINVGVSTAGTLIGNYDEVNNPTGTRTKPGLFGPFGPTENVPVETSLDLALVGSPNTRTSGAFRMEFDFNAGLIAMSDYSTDFLASGAESLTAEITLMTETFRTRNPTFLYLGGFPITIPVGQITLNSLTATQIGIGPGTLTPIDATHFSFSVVPIVSIAGSVDVLGQTLDLPATPIPLLLSGELEVAGDTALITSVQPLEIINSTPLDQALPQIPLPLPTLDPDNPANVLLDLILSEVGAELTGTLTTVANGRLVPEPASLALLLAGAAFVLRRR